MASWANGIVSSEDAQHSHGSLVRDDGSVVSPALNFGGLLRQFRTEARLTQEELAEAAGISPRSVSDLESAAAFSTRTLPKPPRTSGAPWRSIRASVPPAPGACRTPLTTTAAKKRPG
jgi:DNA-binding XRE family transcriptional regulator